MSHTFYDGTIAVVQNILASLSHILHKAEQQHANPTTLLTARLHADMYPLTDQIRIATQFSENLAARLTGREPVVYDGSTLTTFDKFYERIEIVLKTLGEAGRDVVDGYADVLAATPVGPERTVQMSGASYAHSIAVPNIYFHLTTAYGILRKEGVPLGKRDYYAGFFPQ